MFMKVVWLVWKENGKTRKTGFVPFIYFKPIYTKKDVLNTLRKWAFKMETHFFTQTQFPRKGQGKKPILAFAFTPHELFIMRILPARLNPWVCWLM